MTISQTAASIQQNTQQDKIKRDIAAERKAREKNNFTRINAYFQHSMTGWVIKIMVFQGVNRKLGIVHGMRLCVVSIRYQVGAKICGQKLLFGCRLDQMHCVSIACDFLLVMELRSEPFALPLRWSECPTQPLVARVGILLAQLCLDYVRYVEGT